MILLGVHSAVTPEALHETYPLNDVVREFKGGVLVPQNLIPSFENLARPALDQDMSVVISVKPNPADVTNGNWRIYIEQLARHISANDLSHRVILVFWHEPEDDARDSYPNGTNKPMAFNDGHEFVTYFDTLHDWVKGVDPNIMTSHAALGYGYRPKIGGKRDKSAFVTDPSAWVTKCDIHSIDIYSGRSFPISDTLATSPAFKRWLASRPDNAEWGVSERGWPTTDFAARVQAITSELVWLASLPEAARPVFYIVWATTGTENDPNLLLDPTAVKALNDGFAALLSAPPTDTPPPADDRVTCPMCAGTGKVHPAVNALWQTIKGLFSGIGNA